MVNLATYTFKITDHLVYVAQIILRSFWIHTHV